MKNLLLKVFLAALDESHSKEQPIEELYTLSCLINIPFDEVQDSIIGLVGEGFRSESNSVNDQCFLTIYLLWPRELFRLKNYFSQFQTINDIDPVGEFSKISGANLIQVEAEGLTSEEIKAIKDLIEREGIPFKAMEGKRIFEKGASGYWDELLLAFTVDVTKDVILYLVDRIRVLLKDKPAEDITSTSIREEVKAQLLKEYQLEESEVYLSYYRTFHDKTTMLVYKTDFHTYRVECDKHDKIVAINLD